MKIIDIIGYVLAIPIIIGGIIGGIAILPLLFASWAFRILGFWDNPSISFPRRSYPVNRVETDDCWMIDILKLLISEGACKSLTEAKSLLRQGAIEINGEKVYKRNINVPNNAVLHCGKTFWRKLKLPTLVVDAWEDKKAKYAKVIDVI